MDSTNFEIVLNYGMEQLSIKPPNSYSSLLEIAKEKYQLIIINRLVYYNEGEEVKISNESDYLCFFDHVDSNKLSEVDIIIKSEESKNKRKKSTQLRKRSTALKQPASSKVPGSDDNCVNDGHDQEIEGDLRNLKYGKDEGKWSNQSYNTNERSRIDYIKQKKEMQKEEQVKRQADDFPIINEEKDNPKIKRKRELKSEKLKKVEETPLDDAEEDLKKGKNFYKNKKK